LSVALDGKRTIPNINCKYQYYLSFKIIRIALRIKQDDRGICFQWHCMLIKKEKLTIATVEVQVLFFCLYSLSWIIILCMLISYKNSGVNRFRLKPNSNIYRVSRTRWITFRVQVEWVKMGWVRVRVEKSCAILQLIRY
jgi:hypothetical protein